MLTIWRKRHIRIQRLTAAKRTVHPQIMPVLTARRLLLNPLLPATITAAAILLPTFLLVLIIRLAAAGRLLRFALDLLHFGALILEPHLHHAHTQTGVLGERFAHLAARLRRQLE